MLRPFERKGHVDCSKGYSQAKQKPAASSGALAFVARQPLGAGKEKCTEDRDFEHHGLAKSSGHSFGAKIAQAAAARRSSNTASRQRRWRRVNNRKSFSSSSEAFAGMGITHRHQKEAQPEDQHDDIQHEVLLVALVFHARRLACTGKEDCDGSRTTNVWSH